MQVRIGRIEGDVRLMRLTSVGLVPGAVVRVERNDKSRPIVLFDCDTRLAINRQECARI